MYSKGASSVISRRPTATSSGNMLEMQNCSPPHTHRKRKGRRRGPPICVPSGDCNAGEAVDSRGDRGHSVRGSTTPSLTGATDGSTVLQLNVIFMVIYLKGPGLDFSCLSVLV